MDGAGCNSDSSNDASFGDTLDAFLAAGNLAGGGSDVGGGTTPPNSGTSPLPLTEALGSGTGFLGGAALGTSAPLGTGAGASSDVFFAAPKPLNPQGVQQHGGLASNFNLISDNNNNNLLGSPFQQLQPPLGAIAGVITAGGTASAAPWTSGTLASGAGGSSASMMGQRSSSGSSLGSALPPSLLPKAETMGKKMAPPEPLGVGAEAPLIPTLFGKRVDLPAAMAAVAPPPPPPPVAAKRPPPPATTRRAPRRAKHPRSTPSTTAAAAAAAADSAAISEESDAYVDSERRRQDRNLREQQRSHQINDQITDLRDMLLAANIRFKPDKYSTLATVAQYIGQLQDRKQSLQQEHEQLLQTITATAQIMTQQYLPPGSSAAGDGESTKAILEDGQPTASGSAMNTTNNAAATPSTDEQQQQLQPKQDGGDASLLSGIDYKAIFAYCIFGTSVTSIDGRFLDCNKGFEDASGFSRAELLPLEAAAAGEPGATPSIGDDGTERNLSLFNVLARQDMERVFHTMSDMLKRPPPESATTVPPAGGDNKGGGDSWTSPVTLCRKPNDAVQLCLSLVRTATPDRRPRLFNCTLIPQDQALQQQQPLKTAG